MSTIFYGSPVYRGLGGDIARVVAVESLVLICADDDPDSTGVTIAMEPQQARTFAEAVYRAANNAEGDQLQVTREASMTEEQIRSDERERIAMALEAEADVIPCHEDAMVARYCARLVRANFSYDDAERADREQGQRDYFDLLARHDAHFAAWQATKARADKAEAALDHTQQWYAERVRKIEDVAKREGLWPEIAAILANGTAPRMLPDGSFSYDPPTYAQQLNIAKHRAERAEAERDALVAAAYEVATMWLIEAGIAGDHISDPLASCIRALTPADAEVALQRVVDAAWNEAVTDAERIADGWGNCARDVDMAREIHALKRPEASHE